jgi:hypothetical protein
MEPFHPADRIQDLQYFGEFGGVNPSISDSSTYTFLSAKTMFDTFEGNAEGRLKGCDEGTMLGCVVGTCDGCVDGWYVGTIVGWLEGVPLGCGEGW